MNLDIMDKIKNIEIIVGSKYFFKGIKGFMPKDIDKVVYDSLEELTISHNDYLKKIKEYEKKLTKEEVIMLLESV